MALDFAWNHADPPDHEKEELKASINLMGHARELTELAFHHISKYAGSAAFPEPAIRHIEHAQEELRKADCEMRQFLELLEKGLAEL